MRPEFAYKLDLLHALLLVSLLRLRTQLPLAFSARPSSCIVPWIYPRLVLSTQRSLSRRRQPHHSIVLFFSSPGALSSLFLFCSRAATSRSWTVIARFSSHHSYCSDTSHRLLCLWMVWGLFLLIGVKVRVGSKMRFNLSEAA